MPPQNHPPRKPHPHPCESNTQSAKIANTPTAKCKTPPAKAPPAKAKTPMQKLQTPRIITDQKHPELQNAQPRSLIKNTTTKNPIQQQTQNYKLLQLDE